MDALDEVEFEVADEADLGYPKSAIESPIVSIRLCGFDGTYYDIPLEHIIFMALNGNFDEHFGKHPAWKDSKPRIGKACQKIELILDKEGFHQLVESAGGVYQTFEWLRTGLHKIFYLNKDGETIDSFTSGWDNGRLWNIHDEDGNMRIIISGENG